MTEAFFADSYALIEAFTGNPQYQSYLKKPLITSNLHLAELYHAMLRDFDQEMADMLLDHMQRFTVPITSTCIPFAMLLRRHCKEDDLSYADCIGYALSFEWEVPFLTGDERFRNKPHVEFVK